MDLINHGDSEVLIFKNGAKVEEFVGLRPKNEIVEKLEKHL